MNPTQGNGTPTTIRTLRILVAEDDHINQVIAKRMFQKSGYEVEIVNNGLGVLNAIRRSKYDIIYLDLIMPELGGFETARRLREEFKKSAESPWIVALTAISLADELEEYLESGMNSFISKPYKFEDIRDSINDYFERKSV
ncbi:response regulator receiver domain protein [Leptospira inadai serovar Lyme str. 10]|uniref:Response regulator receiver domain protein n=2 Tax=Leptospira inadai serovar Lyme TaxID=293084 RepID=V6HC85_9LEPT|nr:response regulator [Leptospira inadai]EQA37426.1 response regulator receiver domain protein [Leptospira inadai serovar Lyme str. 10]PNV75659.1 response regulator [Leptospira inadai serovar Lyme]